MRFSTEINYLENWQPVFTPSCQIMFKSGFWPDLSVSFIKLKEKEVYCKEVNKTRIACLTLLLSENLLLISAHFIGLVSSGLRKPSDPQ